MEIIKKETYIPDTIPALQEFILIGKEKLKAYKLKVEIIDNLGLAKDVRDKAIEDAQHMAVAMLHAEAKLGELLKNLPPKKPIKLSDGSLNGTIGSLPDGITKKQSHHAQTLAEHSDIIEEVIQDAIKSEDIPTKTEVLQRIKQAKMVESHKRKHNELTLPTGKFNVILADPPWQYDHPISKNRKIERHYPTMSLEDICNIPVKNIFSKDAILFLWVTSPMLEKGLKVLNEWGFSYRTCLVWVKHHHGMGQWVLQKHELLLIGVKGNLFTPLKKPVSVIEHPRGKHSEKPQLYEMIEAMYPNGTYLELFHRGEKRKNWTGWGDESGTIYRRP